MIQIDMQMPANCLECPMCNEYVMCAIPVNGRTWGENDVTAHSQDRPEWCPLKEIFRCKDCGNQECEGHNGYIVCGITGESHPPTWFCADGERK